MSIDRSGAAQPCLGLPLQSAQVETLEQECVARFRHSGSFARNPTVNPGIEVNELGAVLSEGQVMRKFAVL